MTDEEKFIEEHLDESMKEAVKEVIEALTEINPIYSNATLLMNIDNKDVLTLLERDSIEVDSKFLSSLITPYAIAKFILLKVQEKGIIQRIEEALETYLDHTKIEWTIYKDFSNQIMFNNKPEINSEEKPQNLLVKYRVDKETDKIIYSICSGNWGWDLSINQLKALLENTTMSISNIEKKSINTNTHVAQSTPIKVVYNGMIITIESE